MILLYISQIAACIGLNKYQPKWKALRRVFERYKNGVYYEQVQKRLKTFEKPDEKMVRIAKQTNIEQYIDSLKQQEADTSEKLQSAVNVFKDQTDFVAETMKQEKQKIQEQCDQLKSKIEQIHDKTEKVKVVQELKETTSQLEQKKTELSDFKTVQDEWIRTKTTNYGTHHENRMIRNKLIGNIEGSNDKFWKTVLGETWLKRKWGIGGRVDGFRDGKLIEIKNRKRCIFNPIPEYDMVQVQLYMHLLNRSSVVFIQCLPLEDGRFEIQEDEIARDRSYFDKILLPKMQEFVQLFEIFVEHPEIQDEFYSLPDRKKYTVMTKLKRLMQKKQKKRDEPQTLDKYFQPKKKRKVMEHLHFQL